MTRTFAELEIDILELEKDIEVRKVERLLYTVNGLEKFSDYKLCGIGLNKRLLRIDRLLKIVDIEIKRGKVVKEYEQIAKEYQRVFTEYLKEQVERHEILMSDPRLKRELKVLTLENKISVIDGDPRIEISQMLLHQKKKLLNSITQVIIKSFSDGIKVESKFDDSTTRIKLREYLLNIVEPEHSSKVDEFISSIPEFIKGRGTKGVDYFKSQIPVQIEYLTSNERLKLKLEKDDAVRAIITLEREGIIMPVHGYKDKLYQNIFSYKDPTSGLHHNFSSDVRTKRSKTKGTD